jgi:Domain of unknown function (DUF1772)
MTNTSTLGILQFLSLLAVALALVPAGAHLFELPNKIGLPPKQYMVVQNIYRGWALLGAVVIAALLLTGLHTIAVRHQSTAMLLSLLAVVCFAASLAIFFMFTQPMNAAINNWTHMPANFETARRQWEYSHAVNAGLMLIAFASLAASVLASRPVASA